MKTIQPPLLFSLLACAVLTSTGYGNPSLTPGIWKDITPPGINFTNAYGVNDIEVDPNNPSILYACVDQNGLYKSTDGGSSWTMPGVKTGCNYGTSATFLDSPLHLRIDPKNSNHLYCVQGVRGCTQGFWVSTDGGASWTLPAGFVSVAKSTTGYDVYYCSADPADFNHVLIAYHGWWITPNDGNSGVLESTDGGNTWIVHFQSGWGTGNCAWFLGSRNTWLLGSQGTGYWRTTDAGTTWTQVCTNTMTHGGTQLYHSPTTGYYYTGAFQYPIRSTDNGQTWRQLTNGMPYSAYYSVYGDGTTLYTQQATTGILGANAPYITSPETDGLNWTPFNGGAQKFQNGPFDMAYDAANQLMYSANWSAGLWVLKVSGSTDAKYNLRVETRASRVAVNGTICAFSEDRLLLSPDLICARSIGIYNVKGMLVGRAMIGKDGGARVSGNAIGRQILIAKAQ